MKVILYAIITYMVASSGALALDTAKGFATDHLVLYQPNEELQERLPSGDATGLANYIKQIQAVCTEFFATTTRPENFTIVVAIRPGKRSCVWFISSTLPPTDLSREPLRKKLDMITACDVRGGPVAFAIVAQLAGGNTRIPNVNDKDFSPPIPKEWSDATLPKNHGPLPGCYLDVIWPDKPTK